MKVRGKAGVEELKGGREQIVITRDSLQCESRHTGRADRGIGERKSARRYQRRSVMSPTKTRASSLS